MAEDLVFFLRGRPFGGGVNSVCQEFAALVDGFGRGRLIVEERHLEQFRRGYDWSIDALDRLSADASDVPDGAAVVATTNDSLGTVVDMFGERAARIYYYVQDFERLFYGRHTRQHETALSSYGYAQDAVAVVKTSWLESMLLDHTFFPVVKIRPSINRRVYRPQPRPSISRRRLVAMVRPATPRRGSTRTLAVINRLASSPSLELDIDVFGASSADIAEAGLRLDPAVRNHGRVTAARAAEIVRAADFFLDLSDYQAFGRGVAEGMAAGVIPIVTNQGAPPEFVLDGVSGFLVQPQDLDASYAACAQGVRLDRERLDAMRLAAMDAVAGWSTDATAADWFSLMRDA